MNKEADNDDLIVDIKNKETVKVMDSNDKKEVEKKNQVEDNSSQIDQNGSSEKLGNRETKTEITTKAGR